MIKIYIAMLLLGVSLAVSAKPLGDDQILLEEAIQDVHVFYREGGIMSVIHQVDQCYKNSSVPKMYCFYMDYAGRILDAQMIEALNAQSDSKFPTKKYFNDEQFYDRSYHYIYQSAEVSMDEANVHLRDLYVKIVDLLNEQFK